MSAAGRGALNGRGQVLPRALMTHASVPVKHELPRRGAPGRRRVAC
jgi:hypothetical protein